MGKAGGIERRGREAGTKHGNAFQAIDYSSPDSTSGTDNQDH